jgi:hypothetical protein
VWRAGAGRDRGREVLAQSRGARFEERHGDRASLRTRKQHPAATDLLAKML